MHHRRPRTPSVRRAPESAAVVGVGRGGRRRGRRTVGVAAGRRGERRPRGAPPEAVGQTMSRARASARRAPRSTARPAQMPSSTTSAGEALPSPESRSAPAAMPICQSVVDAAPHHLQGDGGDDAHHRGVEARPAPGPRRGRCRSGRRPRRGRPRHRTGEDEAHVAQQRAGPAAEAHPDVGQRVGRRPAGQHLGDGDGVGELPRGEPAALLHHLGVDLREHADAAAEADAPQPEGGGEEVSAGSDARGRWSGVGSAKPFRGAAEDTAHGSIDDSTAPGILCGCRPGRRRSWPAGAAGEASGAAASSSAPWTVRPGRTVLGDVPPAAVRAAARAPRPPPGRDAQRRA